MNRFNPDMMILARERLGMPQSALADAVGVKQATISRYEAGLVTPPPDHLERIAEALDRPQSFFFLQERMYGASSMFHRRRKNLTVKEEKRIHAQVNELRIHAAILLREAEIESRFSFHRLPLDRSGPEQAAQSLRQLWQLPTGPVRSVVAAIERAGGLVFRCPFGTDKVDGISQWPLDSDHVPPVLFVRDDIPGDRQRWTLCHEIGHLALHHLPTPEPEDEADRFASELLMPGREIGPELSRLTLEKAAALKCYWKVSMAAIIRRAYDLEKITERQYRYFYAELARRGYRKCEPAPIPPEEPELFREILDVHRTAHGRDVTQLSSMLGLHEHQFRRDYWQSALGLRIAV
jgi:Zn-dependent peptidase ImmA (M78 family)/DNA-binding XRE family transcriptional regulator